MPRARAGRGSRRARHPATTGRPAGHGRAGVPRCSRGAGRARHRLAGRSPRCTPPRSCAPGSGRRRRCWPRSDSARRDRPGATITARDGCCEARAPTVARARCWVSGVGATTTSVSTLVRVRTRISPRWAARAPTNGSSRSDVASSSSAPAARLSWARPPQIRDSWASASLMLVAWSSQRVWPAGNSMGGPTGAAIVARPPPSGGPRLPAPRSQPRRAGCRPPCRPCRSPTAPTGGAAATRCPTRPPPRPHG